MCLGEPPRLMIHVDVSLQARGSCLRCLRKTLTGGMPTWCKLTWCFFFCFRTFVTAGLPVFAHDPLTSASQVHPVLLERCVEWRHGQDGAE